MTTLLAASVPGAGPLVVAAGLGALGVWWLLPKPKRQSPALGVFASLAGLIVLTVWVANRFGPVSNNLVERILFWLFAGGATLFSGVFLTARNPARGAIAFAFVIVSVCGLFLLLAAPFLMAATIIVYAGAIVVTFLFVLMLSQTRLQSDENDRSREPMLGSLAGFSFLGLVLFALFQTTPASGKDYALPARPMLPDERVKLADAAAKLAEAENLPRGKAMDDAIAVVRLNVSEVAEGPAGIPERLKFAIEPDAVAIRKKADTIKDSLLKIENAFLKAGFGPDDLLKVRHDITKLKTDLRLLAAHGELPARNVSALGYTLYSDYILAVELAGAILLAATIGAVRIASRREAA